MILYLRRVICINFLLQFLRYFPKASGASTTYLTQEEHKFLSKALKNKILKEFPSDDEDEGEVLVQEDVNGVTYYKLANGESPEPVFITHGTENMGRDVVVLV